MARYTIIAAIDEEGGMTLARATFKRLGWNRYLWGAFYSDNMWDLEQQEANEQG